MKQVKITDLHLMLLNQASNGLQTLEEVVNTAKANSPDLPWKSVYYDNRRIFDDLIDLELVEAFTITQTFQYGTKSTITKYRTSYKGDCFLKPSCPVAVDKNSK